MLIPFLIFSSITAEEEEDYLKSISDQIQVITKDLKTLEKAVYQKSDASSQNLVLKKKGVVPCSMLLFLDN